MKNGRKYEGIVDDEYYIENFGQPVKTIINYRDNNLFLTTSAEEDISIYSSEVESVALKIIDQYDREL